MRPDLGRSNIFELSDRPVRSHGRESRSFRAPARDTLSSGRPRALQATAPKLARRFPSGTEWAGLAGPK